jgi:hypothetical protein
MKSNKTFLYSFIVQIELIFIMFVLLTYTSIKFKIINKVLFFPNRYLQFICKEYIYIYI